MPSAPETHRAVSRKDIGTLLRQLADDVVSWAESELVLARAELHVLRGRLITAAVFAVLAIVVLLTSLFILAQAGVALVAVYIGSEAVAALVVGLALLVLSAICVMLMRRMLTWQAESVFFRWVAPSRNSRFT